jgi:hypothetical protein
MTVLEPGESLIWQGRIGFPFVSSTPAITVMYLIVSWVIWWIWGSYSLAEFCPTKDSVSSCGKFYAVVPAGLLLVALSQSFDWLERRAVESGRAFGAVMLTSRRLIRVSDWPWRRIRAYDYRTQKPRRGIGGVIRFGGIGSVVLSPADASHVLQMMTAGDTRK